jgi:hypothetical protein
MRHGVDAMRKTIREEEPENPSTRISKTLSESQAPPELATHHSSLITRH